MGDWQWRLRQLIRRLRESDVLQNCRYLAHRQLQSPRRVIVIGLVVVFILYCLLASSSTPAITVSQQCLEDRVRLYASELADISVVRDGVHFVGNGYIGLGSDGQLRSSGGKTLSQHTGFAPLVKVKAENLYDWKEATLTDFGMGKMRRIRCYTQESECVCITSTVYAHRTKKGLLVQDVQIANPSKASVRVSLSRVPSPHWRADAERSTPSLPVYVRESVGSNDKSVGAIVCSHTLDDLVIQQQREETLRFTCAVDIRARLSDTVAARRDAINTVLDAFTAAKSAGPPLEREHDSAWNKLNSVTFHLSHSLAPNVLNGAQINETRYAIISNVRAPLSEEGVTPAEKQAAENALLRRDLCYTGHSTLLYPSRLWQTVKTSEEIVSLVDVWLLTLEKRGCASLVKGGATGVVQAFVLSLSAATFHDGHLEVGIDPADLHREIDVNGLELNDAAKASVAFQFRLAPDHVPYLMVSSHSAIYACDGGCVDGPVAVVQTGTKLPVKLTKPLTSILYIASDQKHLEQLRKAIHVTDVDVAPPHEKEVISMHKTGGGGLPTSFWVFLLLLLVAFHVFLIKLLYSEWRKGDSTPYNPYLRQRYFRTH